MIRNSYRNNRTKLNQHELLLGDFLYMTEILPVGSIDFGTFDFACSFVFRQMIWDDEKETAIVV